MTRVRINTSTRAGHEVRVEVVSGPDGKRCLELSRWRLKGKEWMRVDGFEWPIEQPKDVNDMFRVLNEAIDQAYIEAARRWPIGNN